MKLPRDLAAADLEKALRRVFGYQFTRQAGSHRRLGELEVERVRLEQSVHRTDENLRAFKVHPEYDHIEEQASELTSQMHDLANQNVTAGRLLERYRQSMAGEAGAADLARANRTIEEAYQEAGVVLPGLIKKRLGDVREFHQALVRGRREFLTSEADRLEREIAERKRCVAELDSQRASLMLVLETCEIRRSSAPF